ncbi:unnamed protein product, partial [Pylaiella littoralis]
MRPIEGEDMEVLVNIVEDPAFLEEELARDPISAGQAVVWFSCPVANNCAACSQLIRQGVAQVSLPVQQSQTHAPPRGGTADIGGKHTTSSRRWLPVVVLCRPLPIPPRGTPGADVDGTPPQKGGCCSALLSPCLAEAIGLLPLMTREDATSRSGSISNTTTSAADRLLPVQTQQQLSVRELPSSLVSLASAVTLSGPYPLPAPTGRPNGNKNGGRASDPAAQQLPAQLVAALSSILPSALDGQVLAEGSVVRVADLFGLVVTGAWAEDKEWRRCGRVAKEEG